MYLLNHDDANYHINDADNAHSYSTVMYIIWFMHIFQFLANHKMYIVEEEAEKVDLHDDDLFYRASTKLLGDEGSTEWQYRPMNRIFYWKMWWVWII